ncbi:hypothetical protein ACJMK2_033785 [Sinanodonta woodiana]|uniref:Sulfotransferase domain-containing protein n=1 Tax=Sinanodonta woodiana TaxID=1069815 RepID=A0ABD3WRB0_SINWO
MLRKWRQLILIRYKRICFIMISGMFISVYSVILLIHVGIHSAIRVQIVGDSDSSLLGSFNDKDYQNTSLQIPTKPNGNILTALRMENKQILTSSSRYMTNRSLKVMTISADESKEIGDNIYLDEEYSLDDNSDNRHATYSSYESSGNVKNVTRRLPQAIIIGVKKGGTRALLEYLRLHPKIRATGPEPHFFDKHYKKGLEWYRQQMPLTKSDQLTVEKTPSYFVTKGIPEKVYIMSKRTKLIVVVRDPVTRAISDFAQLVSRRPDVKPFEQLALVDNRTKMVDTSWTILKIGIYVKHLVNWLEYFPLRQIHFVSGENLIKDPAHELKLVQEFLGLEPLIDHHYFSFNSTKGFPCFRKHANSSKIHCLNNDKGRTHPSVDPSVIKRLRDFFRPFNARLYQMTGHNFGWT